MGRVSVTMRDWSDRDRSDDCGRVELSPICDHFTIYFVYFIISDLVEIERRCMPGASLYFYRTACSSLAFPFTLRRSCSPSTASKLFSLFLPSSSHEQCSRSSTLTTTFSPLQNSHHLPPPQSSQLCLLSSHELHPFICEFAFFFSFESRPRVVVIDNTDERVFACRCVNG